MVSDEDEAPLDSFSERYIHSHLLHSRNDHYKIRDLHFFFAKQHVKKYLLIVLLKFDYRKVKLDDKFKIYYGDRPCEIYIKSVAANIKRICKLCQLFI